MKMLVRSLYNTKIQYALYTAQNIMFLRGSCIPIYENFCTFAKDHSQEWA